MSITTIELIAKQKEIIEWVYHRSINDTEIPDQPFGLDGLIY